MDLFFCIFTTYIADDADDGADQQQYEDEDEGDEGEYSEEEEIEEEEDDGTIDDIEADERIIPQTYEQMEALYKPAKRSIGELVIPKNLAQQMIETKVEEVAPINEKPATAETSEKLDPEYVSDEAEDLSLSGEEDIEYSDEEEYENDEDEKEDISDVDDSDLLKRLEAKYVRQFTFFKS